VFALAIRDDRLGTSIQRNTCLHAANDRLFDDVDGLELPDIAAAREEASGFASDLMRMEPGRRDWRGCFVRVIGEDQEHLFDLPFLDALL
jgi:hypothetical protein